MPIPEDDPFTISQPLEIQSILQGLLARRVLLRLDVPGHAISIISTLLAWTRGGPLVLDNAREDQINARLLHADEVRVQGQLEGVMIEFRGRLKPGHFEGKPAFFMAAPAQLRRLQRRTLFRVDIPSSSAAHCIIRDPALTSGQGRFRLADLSASGVLLIDPDGLLEALAMGTIFDDCTLVLEADNPLSLQMRLLRSSHVLLENGQRQHRAAFHFFQIPSQQQIVIQQYVGAIERALMAKRWGTE